MADTKIYGINKFQDRTVADGDSVTIIFDEPRREAFSFQVNPSSTVTVSTSLAKSAELIADTGEFGIEGSYTSAVGYIVDNESKVTGIRFAASGGACNVLVREE